MADSNDMNGSGPQRPPRRRTAAEQGEIAMRVPYSWLGEMIELPSDPADLVAEFIRTGTEVESVDTVVSYSQPMC
ncbi:hypothetical protein [Collinsella ihumii]|uniref:hypothetical protein n=1 Tax=Collinsella ihumii TaxID=1720204 RepID=UPI0008304466|nr:hypothetical protein [Collinsella ihumii]